jgi:hypothetical protein
MHAVVKGGKAEKEEKKKRKGSKKSCDGLFLYPLCLSMS